ncbi:MAG: PRTRC system ThiF family protein [Chitinophagaceae bacterium]|nr:PRTRC system ThiF family protein [Chitinophagaceae bacterium]
MKTKTAIHFTDNYLLRPTNPITVNIIGAGGTGSQVLTAMARINHSLLALGHPGLQVQLFDDDTVTKANLGRQLFAEADLGMYKTACLVNRSNRFFGTSWKALCCKYSKADQHYLPQQGAANITLSCVDNVAARFEIASILKTLPSTPGRSPYKPLYWMDFGNSRHTGQVILSTVGAIQQPSSKKYIPVDTLPFITDEFATLLAHSGNTDTTPSCSLAEALTRQDLFINSSLAQMGASLLWSLLREGMTENRGFFVNLKDFRSHPLKVETALAALIPLKTSKRRQQAA